MASVTKTVRSNPDPETNEITELSILQDDAHTLMTIVHVKGTSAKPILRADLKDVFSVRLTKYSLQPASGYPAYPVWAYWGKVKYNSRGVKPVLQDIAGGGVTLTYNSVAYDPADMDTAGKPTDLPHVQVLADPKLQTINVVVTIKPASNPPNSTCNNGWIDFDIQHTLPGNLNHDDPNFAWEHRLLFPIFNFAASDVPFHKLIAGGLQCGALSLEEQLTDSSNSASGFIMHMDDDHGHRKAVAYDPERQNPADPNSPIVAYKFAFDLLNSIHLKDAPEGRVYVRPSSYQLSLGDAYGFGGNLTFYRLRAFSIVSVFGQSPVDWRDVLSIYRRWVQRRNPAFYTKYKTRTEAGPVDDMAPHTVTANYGLDGQVGPERDAKLAAWLEMHPIKHGEPDVKVPAPNESVLSLLSRARTKLNTWRALAELRPEKSDGTLLAVTSAAAAASQDANRLDVFVRGSDNKMWHKAWNGSQWSAWQDRGGYLHSAPAAVSWGLNRIDCFVRGKDGSGKYVLYHKWLDGSTWSGWDGSPGRPAGAAAEDATADVEVASAPAVASWAPGRLDVFIKGSDNALWQRTRVGSTWSKWKNLGVFLHSGPAAVSVAPNRIDCFVRGRSGVPFILYQKTFDGQTWSGWIGHGNPPLVEPASAPAVSSWGANRLDVFMRGTDNALWRRAWDGDGPGNGWGAWERIAGNFIDDPAAVSWGTNRIDCFVRGKGAESRMSHLYSDSSTKLEAQLWGTEMAGFYRYYGGFPFAANAVSGDSTKFRRAMDELVSNGIVPLMTTDPLCPILNRGRFRGHMIKDSNGQWVRAIPHPFPDSIKRSTCAATDVTIRIPNLPPYHADRVWAVLPNIFLDPNPANTGSCADAVTAQAFQQLDNYGRNRSSPPGALGSGMFRVIQTRMCPIKQPTEEVYLNKWARDGLLANGVRLIEFMKHELMGDCYDKRHNHIDASMTPPGSQYTQTIGTGSWFVKRGQNILKGVQDLGFPADHSFSLTCEFTPVEQVIPFVDEYYSGSAYFHFVYSNRLTPKLTPGSSGWATHPGYKEKRRGPFRVPPTFMLAPERDTDKGDPLAGVSSGRRPLTIYEISLLPTQAEKDAENAFRAQSFAAWYGTCLGQFNNNFDIPDHGIAPQDYVTDTGDTYTYRRGVQDMFSTRARLFEIGTRAVEGYRMLLPAVQLEEPYDFNEEVINMTARAFQLQMGAKDILRKGVMLGRTALLTGQRELWAWGNFYQVARRFEDVKVLMDDIGSEDAYLTARWRERRVRDFISQAVDKEIYKRKLPSPAFEEIYRNEIVIYQQIAHGIWQLGEGDARRVLYLFANVGNAPADVQFHYDKGLEGVTQPWSKDSVVIGTEGTIRTTGKVSFGSMETSLKLPPRSFAGIEIRKI